MNHFVEVFRPCIGRPLSALAWRPITCDTPGVVSTLNDRQFEFSGGASLFFDNHEAFLTWQSTSDGEYCLSAAPALSDWRPFSLDMVHASGEAPWGKLIGAILVRVIFLRDSLGSDDVVAAHLFFDLDGTSTDLWIGVGKDGKCSDYDDLVISVGSSPTNADELEEIAAVGSE